MEFVPAPDFPTGGQIMGRGGARKAYLEGRGSVILRAKTRIEEIRKDRFAIIVDEIPYQVNKATMIERIADLVREKRLEGISHVQDESDRVGVRVVIELRRDATPDVVLNQLYPFHAAANLVRVQHACAERRPPGTIDASRFPAPFHYLPRRSCCTTHGVRVAQGARTQPCPVRSGRRGVQRRRGGARRSALRPMRPRPASSLMTRRWPAHEIADYIRLIDDPIHPINEDGTYNLSETQARAILDLRLQRLTAMGVKEVTDELQELAGEDQGIPCESSRSANGSWRSSRPSCARCASNSPCRAAPRSSTGPGDLDDEDLIEREDMVVTITSGGYIKRTSLAEFRAQRRGGKGRRVHGDQGRRRRHHPLRRQHAYAAVVLHNRRHGLQPQMLAPAAGGAHREGQGDRQHPADPDWAFPSPPSCRSTRPKRNGTTIRSSSRPPTAVSGATRCPTFTNVKRNGKIAMKLPEDVSLVNARMCDER